MRKSSAIRAAMRLRKWCTGRPCRGCPFLDKDSCLCFFGTEVQPFRWPAMSFDDDCNKIATRLQQEVVSDEQA